MTDPKDKTIVVTGANSGVGLETARQLARRGAQVVMTARDRTKGEAALEEVRQDTGSDRVSLVLLDLADLRSVEHAADRLLSDYRRIDVLINNAGLGSAKEGRTADGFELVMGTNYIGPFQLTALVLTRLLETAGERGEARVVNVSSLAHRFARRFDPDDLMPEDRSPLREAYSESKLANLLHARELDRRFGDRGLRAHAVHPGFVASGFGRQEHFPGPWQLAFKLTRPMQISPEKGARPSVHCALSEGAAEEGGLYWTKTSPTTPFLPDDPEAVQERLWRRTEELIATTRPPSPSQV